MSFRQALGQIWRGLWRVRHEPSVPLLLASDRLSRFLFQKSEYSVEKRIVKRAAFMPARESGTTSVFHTTELENAAILEIAREHVIPERKKEAHGWADIQVEEVRDTGLEVYYDNQPPRHVDLRGWPSEKDRQHSIAQLLAAAASLHLLE